MIVMANNGESTILTPVFLKTCDKDKDKTAKNGIQIYFLFQLLSSFFLNVIEIHPVTINRVPSQINGPGLSPKSKTPNTDANRGIVEVRGIARETPK